MEKTNYEIFCDKLNLIEMPLGDTMKIQQAAFVLTMDEFAKGFNSASDTALNTINALK